MPDYVVVVIDLNLQPHNTSLYGINLNALDLHELRSFTLSKDDKVGLAFSSAIRSSLMWYDTLYWLFLRDSMVL